MRGLTTQCGVMGEAQRLVPAEICWPHEPILWHGRSTSAWVRGPHKAPRRD